MATAGKWPKSHFKVVLCNLLVKRVWERDPGAGPRRGCRGHDDSCAVVDSLFGLAELSKSRIYPQYDTEPANLS